MINEIFEAVRKIPPEHASNILTVFIVAIVAGSRAIWYYLKNKKEGIFGKTKSEREIVTTFGAIDEHKFINETYQDLIEGLKKRMEELAADVADLGKLRDENTKLQIRVRELEIKNEALKEQNEEQAGLIEELQNRLNNLFMQQKP